MFEHSILCSSHLLRLFLIISSTFVGPIYNRTTKEAGLFDGCKVRFGSFVDDCGGLIFKSNANTSDVIVNCY